MEGKIDKAYFDNLHEKWNDNSDYQTEAFLLDITEAIWKLMEERNINKADLARRMGVSRAYITRTLNGSPNLTIHSLVRIALALGARPIDLFIEQTMPQTESETNENLERNKWQLESQCAKIVLDYAFSIGERKIDSYESEDFEHARSFANEGIQAS